MEAATTKSIEHITNAKFEHLGQTLADLPTIRAYLSRMKIKTDASRALLLDSLNALEQGREDAMLRVLEVKAAAGEASTEVTDLAMRVCGGALADLAGVSTGAERRGPTTRLSRGPTSVA